MANLLRPPRRSGGPAARRAAKRQQDLQAEQGRHPRRLLKQMKRQATLEREIEAHRQEQARVAQELRRLNPPATFFAVDREKDPIVAHLRIGLHNSVLWARDRYFGAAYRDATPMTLWRLFFTQDGFCRETADRITITLKPFTNVHVQQEALAACERLNARRIKTHSGKVIEMAVAQSI